MPRYLYKCNECDNEVTIFLLVSEKAAECPECGSDTSLEKLLTSFRTYTETRTKKKVGTMTEKFIETATGELKQQKKDLEDKR